MYRRGSTEISCHVHSFQDEEEATNAMLSFFLKQRRHEEKQMTLILGLELFVPVLKAMIKQSDQQYPWL